MATRKVVQHADDTIRINGLTVTQAKLIEGPLTEVMYALDVDTLYLNENVLYSSSGSMPPGYTIKVER